MHRLDPPMYFHVSVVFPPPYRIFHVLSLPFSVSEAAELLPGLMGQFVYTLQWLDRSFIFILNHALLSFCPTGLYN